MVDGQWLVAGGRCSMVGHWWSLVSGQISVVSDQWSSVKCNLDFFSGSLLALRMFKLEKVSNR